LQQDLEEGQGVEAELKDGRRLD